MSKRSLVWLVCAIIVTVSVGTFSVYRIIRHSGAPDIPACVAVPAEDDRQLTLIFTGDLMQHLPQVQAAFRRDGGIDYTACFSRLKNYFASADFVIANLETTLGGEPYSGYPQFRSPGALAGAMRRVGIDVAVAANNHIRKEDPERRIHNIVLMGSGEPFDNYDNVVKFLRLVNDPKGLNISLRNISLSTCGLVPKMRAFADEGLPVTLSISLHAPNDGIRQKIMPVAHAYAIEDVLSACRNYVEKTGRRVVFEYALIKNVNCDVKCAEELARRLRGLQCHVNLIPLNAVKERNLEAPTKQDVQAFLKRLELKNISATVRREMGADIDGACGQLRRKALTEGI